MNPLLDQLKPYPFEKLNALLANITTPDLPPIALSIGEPKHLPADFLVELLCNQQSVISSLGTYPPTKGLPELRTAIADFVNRRFKLASKIDADTQVLPVTGTREGLFSIAQAVIDPSSAGLALLPNPFYQIYEGATLLAGSQPIYLNCTVDTGFVPDFSALTPDQWQQCQLVYICTPGNPSGACLSVESMQSLIRLSDEHNFVIASDECYSEIYDSEPPAGLLQAASLMGRHDYKNCIAFNSLSKRSNLPGLRSGYVCGDAQIITKFLHYRTYHGAAMPVLNQWVSIAAWNDEQHVIENRAHYRAKFDAVLEILSGTWDMQRPAASFYLWPETPVDDQLFSQRLLAESNIKVLPGSFLSRAVDGVNPGANHVRMALVAGIDDCVEAATRIKKAWPQLQASQ